MNQWRTFVVLGGVAVLVLAGVLWFRRAPGAAPRSAASAARAERAAEARSDEAEAEARAARAEARRARDAMRAEILAALRRRDAGAAPAALPKSATQPAKAVSPPAEEEPPHGHYEASYIQEHFRAEMFPMLKQCYEGALARKPALAGKLVLSFSIVGDPQVGGIVEDADFRGRQRSQGRRHGDVRARVPDDAHLRQAPTGGGKVTVRYPIAFAPGEQPPDPPPGSTDAGAHAP